MTIAPRIERLRRIWTPDKEVRQEIDKFLPGALDEQNSILLEALCALVERDRTLTVRFKRNTGSINWERVLLPTGEVEITIWWEPTDV